MSATIPTLKPARLSPTLRPSYFPPLPANPWSLDLDFTRDELDPAISITRSGPKTYWGADGKLHVAAANEWPLEFDPVTGERLGRSVWESRTNLLPWSSDLSKTGWFLALSGGSYQPNASVGPDGELSATLLEVGTGSGSTVYYAFTASNPLTIGQEYTFSYFYKLGTAARSRYSVYATSVNTFVIPATDATGIHVGDGWHWQTVTFVVPPGTVDLRVYPQRDTVGTISIFGCQVEQGTFPSPYIPTAGSPVMRTSDYPVMAVGDWFNPHEGTFVVEYDIPNRGQSAAALWVSNALTGFGPRHQLVLSNVTGNMTYSVVDNNGNVPVNSIASGAALGKTAFAYATNDFAISNAGAAPGVRTEGFPPTDIRWLKIGAAQSATALLANGHIKRIRYYPRRLPNAELQALSAL